jgi:hypothetical protein
MITNWIFRVGDGNNFSNSSKYKIWGIQEKISKSFINNVKDGDRLWFVNNIKGSKIIAVATYKSHNKRNLGELISISHTNEELGWNEDANKFNIEIHYINLYNLSSYDLLTYIRGPFIIRKFNSFTCEIHLEKEYVFIERYCKPSNELLQ